MKLSAPTHVKLGFLSVILGVLVVASPIPFLSQRAGTEGKKVPLREKLLRLGSYGNWPEFSDALTVPDAPGFEVEFPNEPLPNKVYLSQNLTLEEFMSVLENVSSNGFGIRDRFANSKALRFENWTPSYLPVRIPYRHLFAFGLSLVVFGAVAVIFGNAFERLQQAGYAMKLHQGVILAGSLLIAGMAMFPPYIGVRFIPRADQTRFIGYWPIFSPPSRQTVYELWYLKKPDANSALTEFTSRVDVERLGIQILGVVLATTGIAFALRKPRDQNEKSKGDA